MALGTADLPFTVGDLLDAGVTFGAGDNVTLYSPSPAPTGGVFGIRSGTAVAPLSVSGPSLKVSRTEQITEATIEAIGGVGTDGAEQVAAILGVSKGLASSEVQAVGVMGAAKTASTTGNAGNDACGVYAAGRAQGTGANGTAIGAFIVARRDVDTARANGAEIDVLNYTPTPGTYNAAGFSNTLGLWMNAGGDSDSAAAIAIGNPFARQFDVGLGFTSQGASNVGGVKTAAIRDDSKAATSLLINGTHATAAIAVTSGAGPVVVGNTTTDGTDLPLLELYSTSSKSVMMRVGSAAVATFGIKVVNNGGSTSLFMAGSVGQLLTGTAAGDGGIRFSSSKVFHIGRDGGSAALLLGAGVGFNGTAPVAKPTVTGSRGANAALADLLTKLASYGLITDGTS